MEEKKKMKWEKPKLVEIGKSKVISHGEPPSCPGTGQYGEEQD